MPVLVLLPQRLAYCLLVGGRPQSRISVSDSFVLRSAQRSAIVFLEVPPHLFDCGRPLCPRGLHPLSGHDGSNMHHKEADGTTGTHKVAAVMMNAL